MKREAYERYLQLFNARDYDAVLDHFAPAFELTFAGLVFRTPDEVRRFYTFLHDKVEEQVVLKAFVSSDVMVALEADVRITGVKPVSPEEAAEAGLAGLVFPPPGQVVVIPQLIHYHLVEGKIVRAVCAIDVPPPPAA